MLVLAKWIAESQTITLSVIILVTINFFIPMPSKGIYSKSMKYAWIKLFLHIYFFLVFLFWSSYSYFNKNQGNAAFFCGISIIWLLLVLVIILLLIDHYRYKNKSDKTGLDIFMSD